MSKKKIQKTNAIRILEQHQISYKESVFDISEDHLDAKTVATSLGMDPHQVFKTILTVGNITGPVVAVIPGDSEIDFKALAKVSGNKKVEMLPLKDLEQTTGYVRGGCSPVGMKKQFPTYFDESSQSFETIFVSAGKRGVQMEVAPADLCRAAKGQFAALIKK